MTDETFTGDGAAERRPQSMKDMKAAFAAQEKELAEMRAKLIAQDSNKGAHTAAEARRMVKGIAAANRDEYVVIEIFPRRDKTEPEVVNVAPNGVQWALQRRVPTAVPQAVVTALSLAVIDHYDSVETNGEIEQVKTAIVRFPLQNHGFISDYVARQREMGKPIPPKMYERLPPTQRERCGLQPIPERDDM